MQCFTWLLLLALGVVVMATIVRWFEQATEAVDQRWWKKIVVLIVFPPAVWIYPGRISANRPTAVPHHEPVRGFGSVPTTSKPVQASHDAPPPGTPKEFLGVPNISPKKKLPRAAIDPDKIAKLKQKMRDQGMISDDE